MTGTYPSEHWLAAARVAGEPGCLALADSLFPDVEPAVLAAADFAPPAPFEGPLFDLLEDVARSAGARPSPEGAGEPVLGLVVPAVWYGAQPAPNAVFVADHVNLAGRGPLAGRWPAGRVRTFPSMTGVYRPSLLAARLPAASSWAIDEATGEGGAAPCQSSLAPRDRSQAPSTAGPGGPATGPGTAPVRPQHQPPGGRPGAGGPIYFALAVAGVADAGRLTPFESRQMRRCGLVAAAGLLVAPVVIAAYHGLAVAAAGVPREPRGSEGTQ